MVRQTDRRTRSPTQEREPKRERERERERYCQRGWIDQYGTQTASSKQDGHAFPHFRAAAHVLAARREVRLLADGEPTRALAQEPPMKLQIS